MSSVSGPIIINADEGGNTSPCALEINSVSKGIRLPTLTSAQRDAISSPISGLTIFNSDEGANYIYDGSSWRKSIQTIGEFQQFLSSTGTFSTTSSSYVEAETFTTSSISAGDYQIWWNMNYFGSSNSVQPGIRVQINSPGPSTQTISDQAILGCRSTDRYITHSGLTTITLVSGVHTIDVDFQVSSGSTTIEGIEIFLMRVA